MRFISAILISSTLSFSMNIDDVVKSSKNTHQSLIAMQHKIDAIDYNILISNKLPDPEISFTSNSLSSTQAMNYEAINVKQKLPWFGKLDAKNRYKTTTKEIYINKYNVMQTDTALNIYNTFYTINEYKEKISLLTQYKNQNIQKQELYNSYASTDNSSHEHNINSKILISNIDIKLEQYKSTLNSLESNFYYLTNMKSSNINTPKTNLKQNNLEYYLNNINNNPTLKELQQRDNLNSDNIKIKELNLIPNPYIKVGYYNRDQFNDYKAVSIGFSLPIYGRQNLEIENAKALKMSSNSMTLDYKNKIIQYIKTEYGNLIQYYNIYNILTKESLPQISHSIQLSESTIQNGGSLFEHINLLNKKLFIEEQIIENITNYHKTKTKLQALIGEI